MLSLRPVVSPDRSRGPGGTPGGLGVFVAGLLMVAAGGYLLLNQVQVTTSYWSFGGQGSFGLSLLPLLAGIAFLFFDGRSLIGWLLTAVGAVIILAGVLMHMEIYFRQTSLFNTLVMLGLLFGGLGLVARSLVVSKRMLTALVLLIFFALHQDIWLWRESRPLVFGVLPVGLAYHAAYACRLGRDGRAGAPLLAVAPRGHPPR